MTNRLKKKKEKEEKKFSDSMPRHFPKEMAEAKRVFEDWKPRASKVSQGKCRLHGGLCPTVVKLVIGH